ncbi:MAG: hypothetical protein ACODAB_00725 [Gemmatimonadota bacterium]
MRAQLLITPILAVAVATACTETGPTELEAPEAESSISEAESSISEAIPQTEMASVAKSTSIVSEFPNGAVVPGASARLSRTANGVNGWLTTNGLTTGNVYTLWVVVFNHPEECLEANECRLADINEDDPAVGIDLMNAGGHVAGGSGRGTFAGRVKVGDLGIRGVGLQDAFEPEIHLVVRDHGPKLPGATQLKEFAGGCDVYACANVQDALHF